MAQSEVIIDFSEVDDALSMIEKQLDDKGANCVMAGYFTGKAYPNGFEVARNAWVQEKGTERIPARPFMTKASQDVDKWQKVLDMELNRGKMMPQALQRVGQEMRNSIINSIDNGEWIPNSRATIRRKGSSKPLVDTGNLKRSTSYEVGRDDTGA